MKYNYKKTTVNGIEFMTYADFIARGTFATCAATGETKKIQGNGYLKNDLSIRKAIAMAFNLPTFRK